MNFKEFMNNVGNLALCNNLEVDMVDEIAALLIKKASKVKPSELNLFYNNNKEIDTEWGQDIFKSFREYMIDDGRCAECFEPLNEDEDWLVTPVSEDGKVCFECVGYVCPKCGIRVNY